MGPTSDDWKLAVLALRMIEDLADEKFRDELGALGRALAVEGLSAHRCADHLEKRTEFTTTLLPSNFEVEALWARVSQGYEEKHWTLIGAYIARLGSGGLDDPDRLRQQAAAILDASQFLNEIVQWYVNRLKSIGTRDLTNDTIISIMIDWNVQPTETAAQLMAHGHRPVTVGAIAEALSRHRKRSEAGVGVEGPQPMRVLLHRRLDGA